MDKFPYTVRVWCLKSPNPTVLPLWLPCGGAPGADGRWRATKAAVAGNAKGLVKEGAYNYVVLSDILGDEDHRRYGLQSGGSRDGISALQMDIKIEGNTKEIMQVALNQSKRRVCNIPGVMGTGDQQEPLSLTLRRASIPSRSARTRSKT